MTEGKRAYFIMIAMAVLVLAACNRTNYDTIYPTLSDGKYDSEFPYRNCSEQLEEIASSLVKIDVLVFYETFSFSMDDRLTLDQFLANGKNPEDLGGIRNIFTESVGGTGITIYNKNDRIGFLSCAHLVDYPDTVINYFPLNNLFDS